MASANANSVPNENSQTIITKKPKKRRTSNYSEIFHIGNFYSFFLNLSSPKLNSTIGYDISTDDLKVISPKDAVEQSICQCLKEWDSIEDAAIWAQQVSSKRVEHLQMVTRKVFEKKASSNESCSSPLSNGKSSTLKRSMDRKSDQIVEIFNKIVRYKDAVEERKSNLKICEYGEEISKLKQNYKLYDTQTRNMTTLWSSISDERVNEKVGIPKGEVVVRVVVFHCKDASMFQEILVLGSQTLVELRDAIYCLNDQIHASLNQKSAFFFFNKKFYVDFRDSDNIDYTENIRKWIMEKEERQTQFGYEGGDPEEMSRVTFSQLAIRLGEDYLYCHLGDCEHILQFIDIYAHGINDEQDANQYPIQVYQSTKRRTVCAVCDVYSAKKVCYRDKLANQDPMFYCERCYFAAHYSPKGKLLYSDFTTYPLHQD